MAFSTSLPNLERLDIAVNPLGLSEPGPERGEFGLNTDPRFDKLQELVVGDCAISSWEDVVDKFGSLPA